MKLKWLYEGAAKMSLSAHSCKIIYGAKHAKSVESSMCPQMLKKLKFSAIVSGNIEPGRYFSAQYVFSPLFQGKKHSKFIVMQSLMLDVHYRKFDGSLSPKSEELSPSDWRSSLWRRSDRCCVWEIDVLLIALTRHVCRSCRLRRDSRHFQSCFRGDHDVKATQIA